MKNIKLTNDVMNVYLNNKYKNKEFFTDKEVYDILLYPIEPPLLQRSNDDEYNLMLKRKRDNEIFVIKKGNYLYLFKLINAYIEKCEKKYYEEFQNIMEKRKIYFDGCI